mmetsp:Transcript_21286/g.20449  ORF Transcript_21286/g.20449 Transcript_21286/m.20449 type:complete len:85 (-) Transcript_21286:1657-1911(-)
MYGEHVNMKLIKLDSMRTKIIYIGVLVSSIAQFHPMMLLWCHPTKKNQYHPEYRYVVCPQNERRLIDMKQHLNDQHIVPQVDDR